jgi:hypothetical protein
MNIIYDQIPDSADEATLSSCEHCRTVTWAGVPACRCQFGRGAINAESTRQLADSMRRGVEVEARMFKVPSAFKLLAGWNQ